MSLFVNKTHEGGGLPPATASVADSSWSSVWLWTAIVVAVVVDDNDDNDDNDEVEEGEGEAPASFFLDVFFETRLRPAILSRRRTSRIT